MSDWFDVTLISLNIDAARTSSNVKSTVIVSERLQKFRLLAYTSEY